MADVRTFLRQILAELDRRGHSGEPTATSRKWLAAIDGYRAEWNAFTAPGYSDDSSPINPQRAAVEIDKALPEDAILVSDIGVHHNWLLQFCNPTRPDSLIGSMGFGPMGFGVAGVMGAKLAAPGRPCVSVCGDGAFFMHANVLGTAVEYNIPVVWVVWNNYAYGSIRGLQRGYLDTANWQPIFIIPIPAFPIIPILPRWPDQPVLKGLALTVLVILATLFWQGSKAIVPI